MLELTKKQITNGIVEFSFQVPEQSAAGVEQALKALVALLPSGAAQPILRNPEGEELTILPTPPAHRVLCGFRKREGWTQQELAERLGIKQQHVSEMENGKRPITIKTAKSLAALFGTAYKTFL
ncbi:MAG: helix-turn-helix transcriptional regulator [Humidesulfovibrio sp.]